MLKNPLIPDILFLLQQHPEGITEYLVIKSLEEHTGFEHIGDDYQLAIFQKHFMVMNALHQLQKILMTEEQLFLDISPLKIQLISSSNQSNYKELTESEDAKLSEYYLDWSNFENTDKEDVENLLADFWKLYISADNRMEALAILELKEDACGETINRRYRELAAIHHPDKGGDQAIFISIRQAYETLSPVK
ncbi:MAG: DnaJ domain-containing protein [Gammaproteobacteria bacterium]|nr:DnaJ domain-containing protein [Gammaproteobacteria bacterium]